MNKKAEGISGIILTVILVVVIVAWLLSLIGRECSKDTDCGKNNYCGSDFTCHEIPALQKNVYEIQLLWPAIILALALIAAAFIIRGKSEKKEGKLFTLPKLPQIPKLVHTPEHKEEHGHGHGHSMHEEH